MSRSAAAGGLRKTLFASALVATATIGAPDLANAASTFSSGGRDPISTIQPSLALTPLVRTGGDFSGLGEIKWFAGNYAPQGYSFANGAILPVVGNDGLFSKLGITYGGDGRTTFALPDLRGRAIIGQGTGNGLTPRSIGQVVGSEAVSLTEANLPSHAHTAAVDGGATTAAGASDPVGNMQPSLVLNQAIARQGNFPTRTGTSYGSDIGNPSIGFVNTSASDQPTALAFGSDFTSAEGANLPVAFNPSLFSLLGTTYGGDGRTTFAVPDLAGRAVEGQGTGPGLEQESLGQKDGVETVGLQNSNLVSHDHGLPGLPDGPGGATDATGSNPASPFENSQPSLGLNYLIALNGVFPPRDIGPGPSGTPYLGEIGLFAGNFAPSGWAMAHGQLLPISPWSALFSILGTTFGGDGRTTFALPDLRGRIAVGTGGPSSWQLGARLGQESNVMTLANMAPHAHDFSFSTPPAVVPLPPALPLFGAGLALLGIAGWRRRRAA